MQHCADTYHDWCNSAGIFKVIWLILTGQRWCQCNVTHSSQIFITTHTAMMFITTQDFIYCTSQLRVCQLTCCYLFFSIHIKMNDSRDAARLWNNACTTKVSDNKRTHYIRGTTFKISHPNTLLDWILNNLPVQTFASIVSEMKM